MPRTRTPDYDGTYQQLDREFLKELDKLYYCVKRKGILEAVDERLGSDAYALCTSIPLTTVNQLVKYILVGVKPQDQALIQLIEGDVFGAVKTDQSILRHLPNTLRLIINHAPLMAYGNKTSVSDWQREGGIIKRNLRGRDT